MKKIFLIFLGLSSLTMIFSQSTRIYDRSQISFTDQNKNTNKTITTKQNKGADFFCEDFSNGFSGNNPFGPWTIEDNGTGETGNVILSGQTSLFNGGTFQSTTNDSYATFDVVGYNLDNDLFNANNVAPGITAYLTMPELNMSDLTSAVITWDAYFYYCCANLSPFTLEISTDNGVTWDSYAAEGNEIAQANVFSSNGYEVAIDISTYAGEDSVLIRFAYNSTLSENYSESYFAYFWAIDDVCITEKPENDLLINYSVISHIPETGLEYGRIPLQQMSNEHYFIANINNFGTAEQNNVTLTASFSNSETTVSLTENIGTMAPGETTDIEMTTSEEFSIGVYSGTFTLTSDEEANGDYFYNNSSDRSFAITDNIYALDGIGVYPETNLVEIGPGMFVNDNNEPLISGALMTKYNLSQSQELYGVKILIPSNNDMIGNNIYSFLANADDIENNDFGNFLLQGDYYTVTQEDINNGFIDLFFDDVYEMNSGSYYAGVYIDNGTEFRILDDNTVPQPSTASMLFVSEMVYTNGNAIAIQLYTSEIVNVRDIDPVGFTINQNIPNPAKNNTTVKYTLSTTNSVTLKLTDITGRIVKSINEGKKVAGQHEIVLNLETLDAGVYTYTLVVGHSQITKKLIKE